MIFDLQFRTDFSECSFTLQYLLALRRKPPVIRRQRQNQQAEAHKHDGVVEGVG